MDYTAIMQAIGTVGFPIVACCAIFYLLEKQGQQHKDEMDKMTDALNNNTIVLNRILERLGGGGND